MIVGCIYPWVRIENSVSDNFSGFSENTWEYIFQTTGVLSLDTTANISNSYVSNCHKFANNVLKKVKNFMAVN